jgi:hypothetical protein
VTSPMKMETPASSETTGTHVPKYTVA